MLTVKQSEEKHCSMLRQESFSRFLMKTKFFSLFSMSFSFSLIYKGIGMGRALRHTAVPEAMPVIISPAMIILTRRLNMAFLQ